MITTKETDSHVVGGTYYVELIVKALIEESAWFCVEPLPDNEWQIYFKPEKTVFIQNFVKDKIYIHGLKKNKEKD